MDALEQKCPATNAARSFTSWDATKVACLGSHTSSIIRSDTGWPNIPPAALMSVTAIVAPRRICSPMLA